MHGKKVWLIKLFTYKKYERLNDRRNQIYNNFFFFNFDDLLVIIGFIEKNDKIRKRPNFDLNLTLGK